MTLLSISGLTQRFDRVTALADVAFDVAEDEFFCIVGPTNAGKSTLLKTIAGLHVPQEGTVRLAGRDVTRLEPRERRVSLLFQNNVLFPDRSGFRNIAFALEAAGIAADEIERRVREVAGVLGVTHLLDRLPRTFSGGEQQRVAIGRAIAGRSDLLLLDEPLSSLDARLRAALRLEFRHLGRDRARGILYVTHDHVEAMSLGDRIAVLHEGRIQQIGTPDDIYHRPVNRFVAGFFGSPPMNILDAEFSESGGRPHLTGPGYEVDIPDVGRLAAHANLPRALQVGVRAEDVRVSASPSPATPIPGRVFWVERLGARRLLDIELGPRVLRAIVPPDHAVATEGNAWIGFTPQAHHLIDRDSGLFLK